MVLMDKNSRVVEVIGIVLVVIGAMSFFNSVFILNNSGQVFWFCYSALFLSGIGILRKDGVMVVSQLNILLIPLIIWNIDFFYFIIVGRPLLGITNYFFVSGLSLGKVLTLQHVITIPLTLFCLYLIKVMERCAWKLSLIQIFIFYFLSLLLTDPLQNVNCVFRFCGQISPIPLYPLAWFGGFVVMILVSNYILFEIFLGEKD